MQIKKAAAPASRFARSVGRWYHSKRVRFAGVVSAALAVAFVAGVLAHSSGGLRDLKYEVRRTVRSVQGVGYRLTTDPPRLVLDIKHKHLQRLAYQRERALAAGVLIGGSDDDVPVRVTFDGRSYSAKIRLKGAFADHWRDPQKWSYNIKLKGDHTVHGMRRFSVQNPKTRDYIFEWLYMQALGREGLITSRFEFVELLINGNSKGLYALEERYDKRMIENNSLREGPIVGFNKDLYLQWRMREEWRHGFWTSPIDASRFSKVPAGSPEFKQFETAISLLESFRRGKRTASEVFDVEQMATQMALRALFGSDEYDWRDLKFYYNPLTARLQPIDQEIHSEKIKSPWLTADDGESMLNRQKSLHRPRTEVWWLQPQQTKLVWRFFEDRTFYVHFIRALERVSRPEYLDALRKEVRQRLEANLHLLYREYPDYEFSWETLQTNQQTMRLALYPVKGVHAYWEQTQQDGIRLKIAGIGPLPIEIVGLTVADQKPLPPSAETILDWKKTALLEYQDVLFPRQAAGAPSSNPPPDLRVQYRVWGSDEILETPVYRWHFFNETAFEQDPRLASPNATEADYLIIDESRREIFIKEGTWKITNDLIIPAGYTVFAGAGVKIDLVDEASILSYSPLHWSGSESDPVVVKSSDGTGAGIIVLNAGERSLLRHAVFRGLSAPSRPGAGLTGAITFYQSDVTIEKCLFTSNRRGDDCLNIVRSKFKLLRSAFSQIKSDALDVDFGTGRIAHTSFAKIGNDAIDTSGSEISLEAVQIESVGDKALSAGERSYIRVKNLSISDTEIALTSKDLSTIVADNVLIKNSAVGFVAFQKKSEFGPGQIEITRLTVENVQRDHLIEKGSRLSIDSRSLPAEEENVGEMLYGNLYGKSSR